MPCTVHRNLGNRVLNPSVIPEAISGMRSDSYYKGGRGGVIA